MTENQSQENRLKLVLEDMGPISNPLRFKSEMTIRMHEENFKDLSYEEAMKLVEQNDQFIKDCGVFDPAYNYLANTRDSLLKWAAALNVQKTLGRHDHEIKIHALVSVDDVAVECEFYIDRLHYTDSRRKAMIEAAIREKLLASSEWRGAMRRPVSIDFVEL